MTDASYAFVPWLRRGIAAALGAGSQADPAWLSARVDLHFATPDARQAGVDVALFGPGEVVGFDARAVIRTWPRPDVVDAENNYFPFAEFGQPDLPWRYTPATTTDTRLKPWLCVIVLRDDEIERFDPAAPNRIFPVLTVKSAASLPVLDQSWAWAHVQLSGETSLEPDLAAGLLAETSPRLVARLLCARRLDAETPYTAFIVPTFKRGQLAGLGETVPENLSGIDPAWTTGQSGVQLPVYHRWRFQTGRAGDFEYLVRLLKPHNLPGTVGVREIDVSNPTAGGSGGRLPAAAAGPLKLEAALRALETRGCDWPRVGDEPFLVAFRDLLNRPAALMKGADDIRTVAPPLYGRWHAARDTVKAGEEPVWFNELNVDPRWRVAAGLGTLVVQSQQQQLMASAWRQFDGIRKTNEELRYAQLAREVAVRLHQRVLAIENEEFVLQITAPLQARVRAPSTTATISATLSETAIPNGTLAAQWRRVTRPRGPIGRRIGLIDAPRSSRVLEITNNATIDVAPPPVAGSKVLTLAQLTLPSGAPASDIGLLTTEISTAPTVTTYKPVHVDISGKVLMAEVATAPIERQELAHSGSDVATGTNDVFTDDDVPEDRPVEAVFRDVASQTLVRIDVPPIAAPPYQLADLPGLRQHVVAALDPLLTIAAAYRRRLTGPATLPERLDPLQTVMAAPTFGQPMYEPLRDLSQDWLLPGLEQVPVNTVSLLLTNQRFVEAYMVGLNHEMARELLWNEYPTDQRGTYFRQFWDSRGTVPPPDRPLDPETLKDIAQLHIWQRSASLGKNSSRPSLPEDRDRLVLLVRGDLLRRYPNTLVYAAKATGNHDLSTEEMHPVFGGTLEPDVAFFGFDMTTEQARGDDTIQEPGWFFVLQEQPTEPRFGLDHPDHAGASTLPTTWSQLNWSHLAPTPDALLALTYIDLNASLPNTEFIDDPERPGGVWHMGQNAAEGSDGAQLAYVTLQLPVRIAIHGSDLIPT